MKNLKSILVCFCVAGTLAVKAQNDVIIIDKGAFKEATKKEPRLVNNDQIFKFSPLQMIKGELNFGYERKFSPKSSYEIELGPTISRINGIGGYYHWDPYYVYAQEKSGLGLFASVGYRYYPLDDNFAPNRFYVSPVLKYRLYNFNTVDPTNVLPNQRGDEMEFNFTFNFGYQMWAAETFSFDFFAGVGVGAKQDNWYTINNVWDDATQGYVTSWNKRSDSGARYVFSCGVKVGIGKPSVTE